MRFKHIIILSLLASFHFTTNAQQKENFVNKFKRKIFSSQSDTTRGSSFIALPAFSYAQETGAEFGLASIYNFYIDKKDQNLKTSNISLVGTLTEKKQKKLNLTTDIWTKNNKYHILTDIRFRDWPLNFYGIGNNTWAQDEINIDQKLSRIKIDVEKEIFKNLYFGFNSNYDNYKFNTITDTGIFQLDNVKGIQGGEFLNFGVSMLYDTRDVTTYSNKGFYGRVKYAYAPNFFGKDNFVGSMTEIDLRAFHPLRNNLTLAIQALYKGTYGKDVPFYVMRELGGDMSMRGYYLGRYRDKNYVTAQAEIRYRFHPRLGAVAFLGTGSTFSNQYHARFVPSYGLGGRYFFNLEHRTSIRIDYAYGEKRLGEKRQSGFYLSLSEAF